MEGGAAETVVEAPNVICFCKVIVPLTAPRVLMVTPDIVEVSCVATTDGLPAVVAIEAV